MRWHRNHLARGRVRGDRPSPTMLAAGALVAAGLLVGCGTSKGASGALARSRPLVGARTPPLLVVASVYPLAQLVSYIGGPDVNVVDLPGPGVQPQGLTLSPAQREELRRAALVVYVGDGYQPEVETQAQTLPRQGHLAALPAVSKQSLPYEFWLDPYLMAGAATSIALALSAADPGQREQFANGSRDFQALAESIESDFTSSLSNCAQSYFVTADDAFASMARAFDLVDVPVSSAGVAAAVSTVSQHQLPEIFSEDGVPSAEVDEVANKAGVKVAELDPMETAPSPGTGASSYFSAMEQVLGTLEGGLGCNITGSFS